MRSKILLNELLSIVHGQKEKRRGEERKVERGEERKGRRKEKEKKSKERKRKKKKSTGTAKSSFIVEVPCSIVYSFGVTEIMVHFIPLWSQVSCKAYRI